MGGGNPGQELIHEFDPKDNKFRVLSEKLQKKIGYAFAILVPKELCKPKEEKVLSSGCFRQESFTNLLFILLLIPFFSTL